MPLSFLLDENVPAQLWHAIQQHNLGGVDSFDAARVGEFVDLPLGSLDSDILQWTEREGRILVSEDKSTLPGHLANHLKGGNHSPGILVIRARCNVPQVVAALAVIAHAGEPVDYQDRIEYIP